MKTITLLCLLASPCYAGPLDVHATARVLFDRLPNVQQTADFGEVCGMGPNSNPHIGYCTTGNTIFILDDFITRPEAAYEMAHVLGHAIQVRHGVADVALREIRARRSEEAALRGMVTRQVDCVAGVLMALSGEAPFDLRSLREEPFTQSHWGRDPLNGGPRVSIGLEPRAEWYDIGYAAQDFAACTVGEMSADLIVAARKP